jgi:coenzyme F420-reducing hydrogenase beta subunit
MAISTLSQVAIDIIGKEQCVSCFGCFVACPRQAVQMELNLEGFYRPVIDREVCSQCGCCARHCPMISANEPVFELTPAVFAAWSANETTRLASSSGGIFTELATEIINRGGVVFGCEWGDNLTPRHIEVTSLKALSFLRGSKYLQSKVGRTYQEMANLAEKGTPVLFCGTPCQVAAAKLFFRPSMRSQAIFVDLLCGGVPSMHLFRRYLDYLFPKATAEKISFRNKEQGWSLFQVQAKSTKGAVYRRDALRDEFIRAYLSRVCLNQPCLDCRFAALPRQGDISLGDFWGVPEQWFDERGVSVALANTQSGKELLARLAGEGKIELHLSDLATATKYNPRLISGQAEPPPQRSACLQAIAAGAEFSKLRRYWAGTSRQQFRAFVRNLIPKQILRRLRHLRRSEVRS